MKSKAIGLISTLVLCLAGVHISNAYMPDGLRFFVGYFCGVAVMFVTAIARDKESRAKSTTSTEQAQPQATYRTQAIVGDGNVQSSGSIVSNYSGSGSVRMRVGDYMLKARNLSGVSVSADGPRMSLTIGGQTLTIEHKPRCPDPTCD